MVLESPMSPEEFRKTQRDWFANIRQMEEESKKRASELQSTRETKETFIQQQREVSRYREFTIKPVSPEEKQGIILAHQWEETVKNACSDILGVNNHH
jgi:hypothetical protein